MESRDAADEPDELERLIAHVVDTFESAGEDTGLAVLTELCKDHPHHASKLRSRIASIRELGLVGKRSNGLDVPERLGPFRLLKPLGEGGMGIVYLARQDDLGRDVALKVVRPDYLFFPSAKNRFRREVEVIAKLQHPGIVPIYTVGEENGIPYFAMEHLKGETLEQAIQRLSSRGPETLEGKDLALDPENAGYLFSGTWEEACVRVVRQVSEAVDHAHRRGVVHRDIKPSNVFITNDGTSRVMLLDFGLAAASGTGKLTRSGAMLGSIYYMAPEQIRGEADAVGPQTDVYSLGVLLYELLTLRIAFPGQTETEVMQAIELGLPQPVRKLNPSTSWEAETVCMTAMERDRPRRYASAADFARDLDNILGKRPIEARRVGTWRRLQRWIERNRALAAAVALGACIVIGGPSFYAWETHESAAAIASQRDRAERNFERALEAVDRMLSHVGEVDLRFMPQMESVRKQILEDAVRLLDQFLAEEAHDARALREASRGRIRLGILLDDLGRHTESAAAFARAIETSGELIAAEPNAVENRKPLIEAILHRASALKAAGHADESSELQQRATAELARPELIAADSAFVARCTVSNDHQKALNLDAEQKYPDARAMFEKVTSYADECIKKYPDDESFTAVAAQAWNDYGLLLLQHFGKANEMNADAEKALVRTIELNQRLAAQFPTPIKKYELSVARNNLAGTYLRGKKFDLAREQCVQAKQILGDLVTSFPDALGYRIQLATIDNQIGLIADYTEDYEAARAAYGDTVAILRDVTARAPGEPRHWNLLAKALENLSTPSMVAKDYENASRLLREAVETQRRAMELAPNDVNYRRDLSNHLDALGMVRGLEGKYDEAMMIIEEIPTKWFPNIWMSWWEGACHTATMLQRIRENASLAEAAKAPLIAQYAERGVKLLRAALDHGKPQTVSLRAERRLQGLAGTAPFEKLATETDAAAAAKK